MVNSVKFCVVGILFGLGMSIGSCVSEDDMEIVEVPTVEVVDTTTVMDTTTMTTPEVCSNMTMGELYFEYEDKEFQIFNPIVEITRDTITGDLFNLDASVLFIKKFIQVKERLNENQEIRITIVDVETGPSDCVFPQTLFELNDDNRHLNFCFFPNAVEFEEVKFCNTVSVNVRTVYNATTTGYAYPVEGSMSITHCDEGKISGEFENEFFKNGRFCMVGLE